LGKNLGRIVVHLEAYRQAPDFLAQVVGQSCLTLSAQAGTVQDRLYGVIEILNPRERPFSSEVVEFLSCP